MTKILAPKSEGPVLGDRETYVEIGNLVFAGTGKETTNLRDIELMLKK